MILFGDSIVNDNNKVNLIAKYIKNFPNVENPAQKIVFASVYIPEKGTLKKAQYLAEEAEILEYCETYGIKIIGCGVAAYFKAMTGSAHFEQLAGRALTGVGLWKGYTIIPMINYLSVNVRPALFKAYQKCNQAFETVLTGGEIVGESKVELPVKQFIKTATEAKDALKALFKNDKLFVDIETTGLRFETDRLLTIALGAGEEGGICIAIHPDYHSSQEYVKIIAILKSFFENYKGTLVLHNAVFDIAFIVHEILRNRRWDIDHHKIISKLKIYDTMLAAYVLMNSTADKTLGLKTLAFDKYGEYDADIEQSQLKHYSFEEVAEYNIRDISATAYIFNRLDKRLDKENMRPVFEDWMKYMYTVLKLKMCGLPINLDKVKEAIETIDTIIAQETDILAKNKYILSAEAIIRNIALNKYNATHKKQKTLEDITDKFNPNSSAHKRILLFEVMGLETDKVTKTGALSTDKNVMQELIDTVEEDKAEVLKMLMDLSEASKVKGTYLETFLEKAVEVRKGEYRLFGDFLLTGTISGRLSSRNPSLMNLPAHSRAGELVKACFEAPKGYYWAGSDYNALEARLTAIETQCPAIVKVFTDDLDSHSLNASVFFKEELQNRGIVIDPTDVNSVNSIKKLAPDIRQKAKTCGFALNYGCGPSKVAQIIKTSKEVGQHIYNSYIELYKEMKEYAEQAAEFARENGFVISPISGLRLLLPDINSSDGALRSKAERVAFNFKIQSGAVLTIRAINRIHQYIENNNLENDIQVILTIHDSIYFLIKKDVNLITEFNKVLIEAMTRPYRDNQVIPLTAELDIGYNWKDVVTIPNNASVEEVKDILNKLEEIK